MWRRLRVRLSKCLRQLRGKGGRIASLRQPWMQEIAACQRIITAAQPHPHYLRAYRDQEVLYWLHIPKWIYAARTSRPVRRCLDIGCAYGTLALFCRRLLGCEVYCTDVTERYFTPLLAETHGLVFAENNFELDDLPWNLSFDMVIFTEVLEHLNFHPVPTLVKLRNLLADQGRLYLSTPDAYEWGRITKYYAGMDEMPSPHPGLAMVDDHVYHYCKSELLAILEAAGLAVERLDYSPGVAHRHLNLTVVKKDLLSAGRTGAE